MDLIVTAYVQNVLDDVVAIGILHQLERLLDNPCNKMGTRSTVARIKTALDNATSMTVACHIFNTRSNSIKDELGVLIRKLEQDTLNGMIAMTINTKPRSRRFQRIRQNLGSRLLLLLALLPLGSILGRLLLLFLLVLLLGILTVLTIILLVLLFVHGTHLDNLLDRPSSMEVQASIDKARAHAAHERHPFLGGDAFQNLLEEVVPEGVDHGLGPEGQSFI
mmetsp:Transcript_3615/g.8003  ORF Transcript_3615/g.8003 Transcript_3615/m.8003 type:complete len:221 (-) Transcript_3615:589-1251(-)